MKLNVPFYVQTNNNDCGPTSLQMVLKFLENKEYSKEELIKLTDSDESGVTWTLGIAKAAAQLEHKTEFYSLKLGFNPKNYELAFYKNEANSANETEEKLKKLRKEAVSFGLKMEEKSLSIEEIVSRINEKCVAIILLDWGKIKEVESYIGHFVPIVGYDEKNIYIHNPGLHMRGPFLAITKELFDKARKSAGTDEDIIFINKK